ncbi:hypothetical protein CBR_g66744 [Chara braunii]|uniref:Integrase catalytic domain-containing protein n=1 Tax=Chara braunii TaxID=69332 RepID=A0A388JQ93_CHABU|nr:hypothetical protein CBR_g66744 [Chara braunii]|eukprot:GBG59938.1 hypothetical protein CBR_g66744 [Chara braunii]
MRFCQLLSRDEKEGIVFTTIRGEVFDYEGNSIDPNIEGGMRKEAFRRMGRPLPATFRIASPDEAQLAEVEEAMASLHIHDSPTEPEGFREQVVERAQTITRRLARCRDSIARLCVDMEEVWPGLPNVFLFGEWGDKREDASGQAGTSAPRETSQTGSMVQIGQQEYSALVDDGAEMNIIRERHAIEVGLKINRDDYGFLVGASGSTPFCGTASGVLVTIRKVKVRSYFYVLPRVEHEVLLGRAFLCRSESIIINKHDGIMFVILCDPVCGYYEVVKCANSGPYCSRNRLNPESYSFPESENLRREKESLGEESNAQADQTEKSVPVDAFPKEEEARLSINTLAYLTDAATRHGKLIWNALAFHEVRPKLVVEEPFIEEDPWGEQTAEEMMRLTLTGDIDLMLDPLTIEQGHTQVDAAFQIIGRMSYIMNLLVHEDRLRLMNAGEGGGEVKEAFKEKEYELGESAMVHSDLLVMPPGINGYRYIFDARDNLTGFVDGRAIRERTGSVLAECIEEYYLRYPFVQEIVMDRGGEFRTKEVQTLLKRLGVGKGQRWIPGSGERPAGG